MSSGSDQDFKSIYQNSIAMFNRFTYIPDQIQARLRSDIAC